MIYQITNPELQLERTKPKTQIISDQCANNVQIRSFSWSVFSRIQSKYGKNGPEKTPYLDNFHAVDICRIKVFPESQITLKYHSA